MHQWQLQARRPRLASRSRLAHLEKPDSPKTTDVVDWISTMGRGDTGSLLTMTSTFDIDEKGQGITARADIINSVDLSWAFQVFSGAYRDYCRNTCVFGGQKSPTTRSVSTRRTFRSLRWCRRRLSGCLCL
jgi:hypothetical protein